MMRLLFLSLISFSFFRTFGQSPLDLNSYIPPSPNAQSFLKYGDYPVDFSTGVPQINIPLYSVNLKDFSFPISASFHASGRTVALNFSPLGLNWTLQATGVISREIRGKIDEDFLHPENSIAYYSPHDQHYDDLIGFDDTPQRTGFDTKDPEYDVFSINISGISAKFIISQNQIFFLTYFPYKLTYSGLEFVLIDDSGNTYKFGKDNVTGLGFTELNSSNALPTSWFISTITTQLGNTIKFKYGSQATYPSDDAFVGNFSYSDQATVADLDNFSTMNTPAEYTSRMAIARSNSNGGQDFTMGYITEIEFDDGKVLFNYNSQNLLLNNIQVVSKYSLQTTRKVVFTYLSSLPGSSLYLTNNCSVTVQSITSKNGNDISGDEYGFEYYPVQPADNQVAFGSAKDFWGYSNGRTSDAPGGSYIPVPEINIMRTPLQDYMQTLGCNGCRAPSFIHKVGGMIKKIIYPTGGHAEFIYESNFYHDLSNNIKEGPGIRIQKILSSDNLGEKIVKSYKYGNSEDGTGQILWIPGENDYYFIKSVNFADEFWSPWANPNLGSYRWRVYSSEPQPQIQYATRLPVYYPQVTEYVSNEANSKKNGRTIYQYTIPTRIKNTAHIGGGGYENYYFQNFGWEVWSEARLESKQVDKYDVGTNSYLPVSKDQFYYTKFKEASIPQISFYRYHEVRGKLPNNQYGEELERYLATMASSPKQIFYILDKPFTSAVYKLNTQTSTTYNENGTQIQSSVQYFYDNLLHLNPTQILSSMSTENSKLVKRKYPQDITGTIQTTMANKNMLNSVLEEKTFEFKTATSTEVLLSTLQSDYIQSGSLIVKGGIKASYRNAIPDTRIIFSQHDLHGNVLEQQKNNDVKQSYIWDYNSIFPVAEVIGSSVANIAYTSFEADGKGNWNNYTGTINTVSSAPFPPTGKKYYNLSPSATLSKSVTSGKTYIISYWRNNTNSYTITGGTSVQYRAGKTVGSWTYHEHKITATTTTLTISGTGGIDEVRLYPAEAQMSTYTYEPLIGMTSQCDVNNRITYYEYDSFGRLSLVRDQDKNILKKICYNYAGQPESCPPFVNAQQSQSIRKNNCTGCQVGSYVTYTVPAGTYISNISEQDANQQALNDIAANGQAYANTHGSCSVPPNAGANAVNGVSSNVYIIFTNNCTNTNYSYTLNANNTQSFGPFPEGTYTVYLSSSGTYTYIVNGYSQTSSSPVSFFNIAISGAASIQVIN